MAGGGILHHRGSTAPAQDRPGVAQRPRDARLVLHPAQQPVSRPQYRSAHSDGACYGRWRLQMSAYIDDLPPNSGGFTVWPGSHSRIWRDQWDAFLEGEKHTDKHLAERKSGGYNDPVIQRIKVDTQPFDSHGPAGTVFCGTPKFCTWPGRINLPTSSAKRPSTVSSKRQHPSPTHS